MMRLLPTLGDRVRSLLGAIEPEPEPEIHAVRELFVVVAYHKGTETFHGPFSCQADAATWARAKLKFTAMYGWEIEPLYGPEEDGAVPAQPEAARP
ncbi:MAG: hypothetical protein ACJ8FU_08420 [Xanthobacteraceae bacterium]